MTLTILVLAGSALLIAADQLIKLWVLDSLAGGPSRMIIPGLLQLTYVENRGAAFGILQGKTGLLTLVTLVVLVGLLVMLLLGKFRHSPLMSCCFGLIIAGGAGNLIDRMTREFVVDYLDISPLFSFPVFNLADCCVVIGTLLLLIYLLFFEEKAKKKAEEKLAADHSGEDENRG